jgi:hypothetical protein
MKPVRSQATVGSTLGPLGVALLMLVGVTGFPWLAARKLVLLRQCPSRRVRA